jgi:hypothetical protein
VACITRGVPLCQDRIRHMDRSLQQADLDFVMDFFSIVRKALPYPTLPY